MSDNSSHPAAKSVKGKRQSPTRGPTGKLLTAEAFQLFLESGNPEQITDLYLAARRQELAEQSAADQDNVLVGCLLLGFALVVLFGLATVPTIFGLDLSALLSDGRILLPVGFFESVLLMSGVSFLRSAIPPPPVSESAQIKVMLRDLRGLHYELTDTVAAKNAYGSELIKHSTTSQRYQIEQSKLSAELSGAKRAEEFAAATHATALGEERLRTHAVDVERVVGQQVDAVRRRLAQEFAARQTAAARKTQEFRERLVKETNKRVWAEQAESLRRTADLRAENLGLKRQVEVLQVQLNKTNEPSLARARQRARDLAEQEHRVRMAELGAVAAEHEARARQHFERPETPEERFAREAHERLQNTANRQATFDDIKQKVQADLAQIAQTHGDDSLIYHDREATYDELLIELAEEVTQ